jgi:bifunctional ADP-heptose synthase (sugar kinase/adenylyltransferase)
VIVSEPQLIAAVTRDHAAGKRIGFARASFDLLRLDVVRALQASAATSDRLIVAVIDEGGAPVLSAQDRAELVDGLRVVDYAIVCTKDEAGRLMDLLAPYVT